MNPMGHFKHIDNVCNAGQYYYLSLVPNQPDKLINTCISRVIKYLLEFVSKIYLYLWINNNWSLQIVNTYITNIYIGAASS